MALNDRQFVRELQSVRGLAAIVVLLSHASNLYQIKYQHRLFLDVFLNAHAAIVLFFVLSGYVLSIRLIQSPLSLRNITSFFVRRAFRIYPGVWMASAVSIAYLMFAGSHRIEGTSLWATDFLNPAEWTTGRVIRSLLAVNTYLIPPLSTIIVEIVGSIFLPVFVVFVRRSALSAAVCCVILAVISFAASGLPYRFDVLMYMVDFAGGVCVARAITLARGWGEKESGRLAFAGLTMLLFFRSTYFYVTRGELIPMVVDYSQPLCSLVEGVGSALLIAGIVAAPGRFGLLRSRALMFLGDISFSVYLLHFPLMFFCAQALQVAPGLDPSVRTLLLIVLTVASTIALSTVAYKKIELPGIALGKEILDKWRRPASIDASSSAAVNPVDRV